MITKAITADYRKYRAKGAGAWQALGMARTLAAWDAVGEDNVRVRVEYEDEDYFHVYGEPDTDRDRADIIRAIDLHGLTCVISQFRCPCCDDWQDADSIGMCVYDDPADPFENWHVPDLIATAMADRQRMIDDRAVA